jgi:CRP-like cAMP-binding protein
MWQGNLLLRSIARDCGLEGWIESVQFPAGYPIASPGQLLKYFYFPISGVLSTMVQLREGAAAETLTIGNEGMVGVPIWLGVPSSLESVLQRMPGEILRIPARVFCKRIVGHRKTERLLKRFTAYSLRCGSQTNLCNAHHDIQQKMSRWLLNIADRVKSLKLKLTHSSLAHLLGVRRQSVTEVARNMQSAGVIRYRRGEVQILDRHKLEEMTCECYDEMNRLYDRLVRAAL